MGNDEDGLNLQQEPTRRNPHIGDMLRLLVLLCLLTPGASARPVTDPTHTYQVEVPDDWRQGGPGNEHVWMQPDGKAQMYFKVKPLLQLVPFPLGAMADSQSIAYEKAGATVTSDKLTFEGAKAYRVDAVKEDIHIIDTYLPKSDAEAVMLDVRYRPSEDESVPKGVLNSLKRL